MREAARTAAGEHEADRLAREQPREACDIAIELGPDMRVASDRTPREPRAGVARRRQIGRVQQQQNLGCLAARRALGETSLFNRMHCRGCVESATRSSSSLWSTQRRVHGPGTCSRQQQDEIMLGFERIECVGDARVRSPIVAERNPWLTQYAVHFRGVDNTRTPKAPQLLC